MRSRLNQFLKVSIIVGAISLGACDKSRQQPDFEQILTQAESYLLSGQIQSALVESQNLIRIKPDSAAAHELLGDTYLMIGDFKKSAQHYHDALQSDTTSIEIKFKYIDTLIALGRIEPAEKQLQTLTTEQANTATAYKLQGDLALTKRDTQTAKASYEKALALSPQHSDSLLGLALVANTKNNHDQTVDWLNQAIESKVDFTEALLFQGFYFLNNNQADRAEASFSTALATLSKFDVMTSHKYRAIQGLAKALVEQGRTEEAVRLNQTLANSPQGKLQQNLQHALEAYQQGDAAKAEESFELVLQMAPGNQISNLGLGMIKLKEGDIETAEHLLSQASANPDTINEATYRALTLARLRLGKEAAANSILKDGLQRFPESEELQLLLANVLMQKGDFSQADDILNGILEKNPENPNALNLKAFILEGKNEEDKARELYLKSIALQPNFLPAYQGLLSTFKNSPAAAQKQLKSIIAEQKPVALSAQIALSIAHLLAGDFLSAHNLAEQLLEQERGDAQLQQISSNALYGLAVRDYQQQLLQPAYIKLQDSVKLAPSAKNVTLFTRLAVELQRPDEAIQLLNSLTEKQPDFALGYELLGDLALTKNDKKAQHANYEKAWSINPNFRLGLKLFNVKMKGQDQDSVQVAAQHLQQWHDEILKKLKAQEQSNSASDSSQKQLLLEHESSIFALATAFEQNNQPLQAISFYEKLVEINENSPLYLNNLAWLKFTQNQDDAQALAKKAFELAPETGEIIDTYGWILVQNGQKEEGIELLKKASEKSPNNKTIQEHLEQASKMQSKSI